MGNGGAEYKLLGEPAIRGEYDPIKFKLVFPINRDGVPKEAISCAYRDRRGYVWISSWGDGVAWTRDATDALRPNWHHLTTTNGLCYDNVNGFAEDAKGRLWIGTDHGISILQPGAEKLRSENSPEPREEDRFVNNALVTQFANLNVKSITNDGEGRIFLGTIGGLIIVHPDESVQLISPDQGLPQKTPQAVFVDSKNRIWAGTWGGGTVQIGRDPYAVSPHLALPEAGAVGRICEDSSGSIWLASLTSGLWKLENEKWIRISVPEGMEKLRVVAAIPDSGALDDAGQFHEVNRDKLDSKEAEEEVTSTEKDNLAFKAFPVYSDESSPDNHFFPSGFLGDYSDLRIDAGHRRHPHSGGTCIRIDYDNKASTQARWAGIYWQYPANNWGNRPGGYDLTGATKLIFWVRGEKGGERIEEFKMGGLTGQYADSDLAGIGPVLLTKEWKKYTIDLDDKDLSHVGGGFAWSANLEGNPDGFTFYLDDIRYE